MKKLVSLLLALLVGTAPARGADSRPAVLELRDGDRIVLLGNTLIEREQLAGYWETMLTRRQPGLALTLRNLGWSGDTVWGEARAGFGTPADGFRKLLEQVRDQKPTVLLIAYGANEAFAGPARLPDFEQGLNTLLDKLADTKARMILIAPLPQEDLGRPLPDPVPQNANLALYRDALGKIAKQRGLGFVDLFELAGAGKRPGPALTDNGLHLTTAGYWRSAAWLEQGLGLTPAAWTIDFDIKGKLQANGAVVKLDLKAPRSFQVADSVLPLPPPGEARGLATPPAWQRTLRVRGLAEGKHRLEIDGKPIHTATAQEWAASVVLTQGPSVAQAEALRAAIRDKNMLFFHRWRPQNDTYLFGFRKHEQGQNAKEVPQFDPLIADQEKKIAGLRQPVAQRYDLVPVSEKP